MREIKFRALYRDKIYPVLEMSFYNDGSYNISTMGYDGSEKVYPDNGHIKAVMQYTGLKDTNGEEIYEGDIIEYNAHIGGNKYKKRTHLVTWDITSAGFYWGRGTWKPGLGGASVKVIGNIYENPELLK